MQTCGQAVIGCVLQLDCFFQGVSGHDAQDGAEVLSHVVLGTGLDTFTNTGAPQAARLVQFLRLDKPTLARAEGGQTAQQLLFRLLNNGAHLGLNVLRVCYVQRADGVNQLTAETLGLCHGANQDNGRTSGALLTCVTECRVNNILDGKVDVSVRGDNNRVLTRGLTEQGQVITP